MTGQAGTFAQEGLTQSQVNRLSVDLAGGSSSQNFFVQGRQRFDIEIKRLQESQTTESKPVLVINEALRNQVRQELDNREIDITPQKQK